MLEKLFHLKENKTSVRTELIAGLTTFLAMAYILGVNPSVLGDAGMDVSSVFLATALSAAVASVIMGLLANYPVALAAGMGVNALFAYTVCGQMGYSWSAALAGVFISGVIFILISVTGVRKMIINAIPVQMKLAIGAGIGFFIAFVGLKNAGIVVANESTFVAIGNFSDPTVLLALFGCRVRRHGHHRADRYRRRHCVPHRGHAFAAGWFIHHHELPHGGRRRIHERIRRAVRGSGQEPGDDLLVLIRRFL